MIRMGKLGYEERDLLERVLKRMTSPYDGTMRWRMVSEMFDLNEELSRALCQEFGLDPDGFV